MSNYSGNIHTENDKFCLIVGRNNRAELGNRTFFT